MTVLFVSEVLDIEPFDYQAELLNAVNQKVRRLSIKAGHGCGKSSCASWLMIWYLLTRKAKIIVTSPTQTQLMDAVFAELKSNLNKLPTPLRSLINVNRTG